MTEPRTVTLTTEDILGLTYLELARALAIAGVVIAEALPLLERVGRSRAAPDELERGMTLLYAMAWQVVRRDEPAATWTDAQTWRVIWDVESKRDPVADAEARAGAEASILTGLPPTVAGAMSVRELDAFAEIRTAAAAGSGSRRSGG